MPSARIRAADRTRLRASILAAIRDSVLPAYTKFTAYTMLRYSGDFTAAAEWLIEHKYTTPARLANERSAHIGRAVR